MGVGGDGNEVGGELTIDDTGNIIVSSSFYGISDFDPGPGELIFDASGPFRTDLFMVKYDTDGAFVWAKHIKGDLQAACSGIGTDAQGNIYMSGFFDDNRDFDPSADTAFLHFRGPWEGFVASYTPNGEYRWAHRIGNNGDDWVNDIVVQADGTSYSSGYFSTTVDFDPGPDSTKFTAVNTDAFVLKLTGDGQYLWARAIGGISFDQGRDIAVDPLGDIYLTGWYAETVDFDPGPGVAELTSTGANDLDDAYVMKLSSAGEYRWAYSLGGFSDDAGHRIDLDTDGNIALSGLFQGNAIFRPGTPGPDSVTSAGSTDVYLAKWEQCGPLRFNTEINIFEASLTSAQETGSYQWIDCDNGFALIPGATNQTYLATATGNYAVILTEDFCTVTTECVFVAVTGVAEVENEPLRVYPNPARHTWFIEMPELNGPSTLMIKESTGRTVYQKTDLIRGVVEMSVSIPPGVYLVTVETANGRKTAKLLMR